MKQTCMIALCDILGFKNLVEQNALDTVVQDHLGWLRKSLHHAIHQGEFPHEIPSLPVLQAQERLGLAWFSDTFFIYTRDDTNQNVTALLDCLRWLLFETMFEVGTRVRCGVSYGEVFIDPANSTYVGVPLIEAHELEEGQAWSGGALTPHAVSRCEEIARTEGQKSDAIVQYEVPLTGDKTLNTYAIDWTTGIHQGFELPWSPTRDKPSKEEWVNQADICKKWGNTRLFHDIVCDTCRKRRS